jgi:hypothetical protein
MTNKPKLLSTTPSSTTGGKTAAKKAGKSGQEKHNAFPLERVNRVPPLGSCPTLKDHNRTSFSVRELYRPVNVL